MVDTFTSTTRTGFFGSIKKAIVGTLIGLIMVPASVGLLSWNEYRTIHRTHGLNEGASLVQSVDPASTSPSLAGTLIHLNGRAETEERLRDEVFGIEEQAIRLIRNVQMYQWVEDKDTKTRNGKKTTTYNYDKKWKSGRENHESFKHSNGHENPNAKFAESSLAADKVNLGAYLLNKSLKNSIHSKEKVEWSEDLIAALPDDIRDHSLVNGEYLYWSMKGLPSTENPKLGDQRISFDVVRPTNVSLVSAVKPNATNQLTPFKTTNGEELERLYVGDFSATEVFEKMQGENTVMAWLIRGGGLLLSFIGFTLIMGVLSAFTERIPIVGSMTRGIIGFVAFMLAIVLTALTIAFAWIAVRPLIAIPLIVVAIGAAVMAWRSSRKPKEFPAPMQNAETPAVLTADDVV